MNLRQARLLLLAFFAFLAAAEPAVLAQRAEHAPRSLTTPQATVALIASREARSTDYWLGLHFQLAEGWHIYWQNPGDSGGPPSVKWRLPSGASVGDIEWPIPERIPVGPLANYGYEGEVVLPVRVRLSGNASAAPLTAVADVSWYICREVCVSKKATLAISLPAPESDRGKMAEWARLIASARADVPSPAPADWQSAVIEEREHFVLSVTTGRPLGRTALFFPLEESQVDDAAAQPVTLTVSTLRIRLKKSDQLMRAPTALRGVVKLPTGRGHVITAPVTPAGPPRN